MFIEEGVICAAFCHLVALSSVQHVALEQKTSKQILAETNFVGFFFLHKIPQVSDILQTSVELVYLFLKN